MKYRMICIFISLFVLLSCQNDGNFDSGVDIDATVEARVQETLDAERDSLDKLPEQDFDYELSVFSFLREFEDNAVVATSKFADTIIKLEGSVESIDFDILGDPYINLTSFGFGVSMGDLGLGSVNCMIDFVTIL